MKTATVLAASLLATTSTARAAKVAVFPTQTINLSEPQAQVIGVVLAQRYAAASGKTVIGPLDSAGAIADPKDLPAAAQALGVGEYIESSAIALEKQILISAALVRADGEHEHLVEMTAASLDDLPEVGERIARALHERVPVAETLTLDTVSRKEALPQNRVFTEKVMGLKTSAVAPFGGDFEPMASLGFGGRLEARDYFLEIGAGALIPADSSSSKEGYGGLYAEFGASYYLTHTSVSPYLGLGVSPRLLLGSVNGMNVAPYLQAGLMFFRESSSRVYLDLRVAQNALAMRSQSYDPYTMKEEVVRPTEASLQLGIGW